LSERAGLQATPRFAASEPTRATSLMATPTVEPRLPSWWLEDALAREGDPEPAPALAGDATADVAIVGGGYTGLWTALALRAQAPDLGITVLEAEICGHGPSGRNGGFVHGYWGSLVSVLAVLGDERGLELTRAGEQIIPGIRSWAESRGEDVWLREGGMLEVSAAPAQDASVEAVVAAAARVGRQDQALPLTPEEVAQRVTSPVFRGGVFYPECATVHPGLLVRALRRAALDAGVIVHEHTPMTGLRAGSPNELETPEGTLRAPEVVLATNAALTAWRPAGRNLTNFGSYVVLTEPAPDALAEIGWTGGEALVDGRMFLHYFRTTNDGRVLMGSGSGPIGFGGRIDDRFSRDAPTAARAEAGLRRLLPGLANVRVERAWGGPIDVSADHLPFFRTAPGTRIHYGAGYSGHGVGPAWLGGRILASLALGADDEWTRSPLARRDVPGLPREPFRRLGGGLVRWAIMSCEAAEEQGRTPPLAARAAASLPRLLGMELGTR
jgi:glycine/D-amino acid oxidase-like deaminating enzyme